MSEVQARAETLVVLKVSEEIKQITREVSNGRGSDKAVDSHAAVRALVQLPGNTVDGDSGDGRAGGGDRASTAQSSEPDHDLVLLATVSSGAQEHVVGDVSDDVGVGGTVKQMCD